MLSPPGHRNQTKLGVDLSFVSVMKTLFVFMTLGSRAHDVKQNQQAAG